MMQITFTFSSDLLLRPRFIRLSTPQPGQPYAISSNSATAPIHNFVQASSQGFSFNLLALLHAAAVKKLGYPANEQRFLKRSLLVAGGLYLALNPRHRDLEIRAPLGDFIAGFSHDLGVGLTLLLTSEMLDIPLDELNPIKPQGSSKALDYGALIQSRQTLLQVEAKGLTSTSKSKVKKDIAKKKAVPGNTVLLQNGTTLTAPQGLKLGIIVQAAYREKKRPKSGSSASRGKKRSVAESSIEIIDPDPHPVILRDEDLTAGKYWHFAGIALFAGQDEIAQEFVQRATALHAGVHRDIRLTNYSFEQDRVFSRFHRQFVGVQWQLSDLPVSTQDVWFYQAVDIDIMQDILQKEEFPPTRPYHAPDTQLAQTPIAENLFSDGSYFGMGLFAQPALVPLTTEDEDEGPGQLSLW